MNSSRYLGSSPTIDCTDILQKYVGVKHPCEEYKKLQITNTAPTSNTDNTHAWTNSIVHARIRALSRTHQGTRGCEKKYWFLCTAPSFLLYEICETRIVQLVIVWAD